MVAGGGAGARRHGGPDAAILMHPRTWRGVRRLDSFQPDPPVQCMGKCKKRWRADHLEPGENGERALRECGGELGDARQFNLMFEMFMGAVREDAARIFRARDRAGHLPVNFKNVLQFARRNRRSASPRSARRSATKSRPATSSSATREFEQMEIEFFVPPPKATKWHQRWMDDRMRGTRNLGIATNCNCAR